LSCGKHNSELPATGQIDPNQTARQPTSPEGTESALEGDCTPSIVNTLSP